MNRSEQKQYNTALKIIESYPEALRIVEHYRAVLHNSTPQMAEVKSKVLETKSKAKLEDGYINLDKLLPFRAKKVLTIHFRDYLGTKVDVNNFEIIKLFNIDLDKLANQPNCGKHTFECLYNIIHYYKNELNYR